MAEHMKSMQGGKGSGAGKERMIGGMPSGMTTPHEMMEKRMETMEAMLPTAPAK